MYKEPLPKVITCVHPCLSWCIGFLLSEACGCLTDIPLHGQSGHETCHEWDATSFRKHSWSVFRTLSCKEKGGERERELTTRHQLIQTYDHCTAPQTFPVPLQCAAQPRYILIYNEFSASVWQITSCRAAHQWHAACTMHTPRSMVHDGQRHTNAFSFNQDQSLFKNASATNYTSIDPDS